MERFQYSRPWMVPAMTSSLLTGRLLRISKVSPSAECVAEVLSSIVVSCGARVARARRLATLAGWSSNWIIGHLPMPNLSRMPPKYLQGSGGWVLLRVSGWLWVLTGELKMVISMGDTLQQSNIVTWKMDHFRSDLYTYLKWRFAYASLPEGSEDYQVDKLEFRWIWLHGLIS